MGGKRPSDEVEGLLFDVRWEPQKTALGIPIPPVATYIEEGELAIVRSFLFRFFPPPFLTVSQNPDDLDVEALIRKVIWKHTKGILMTYQYQLQHGPTRNAFGQPGTVVLVAEGIYFRSVTGRDDRLTLIFFYRRYVGAANKPMRRRSCYRHHRPSHGTTQSTGHGRPCGCRACPHVCFGIGPC